MVNVGLKGFLWARYKSSKSKTAREIWQFNSHTYKAYREYLENSKDLGFSAVSGPSGTLADFRPSDKDLATRKPYTFSGIAKIYDSGKAKVEVLEFTHTSLASSLLAWGCSDGSVHVAEGDEPFNFRYEVHDHRAAVTSMAWSLDGLLLLTAAKDGGICLRLSTTGDLVRTFLLSESGAAGCCFNQQNPNFAVVACFDGWLHIFNCSTGREHESMRVVPKSQGGISALAAAGSQLFLADGAGGLHSVRCQFQAGSLKPLQKLSRVSLPGIRAPAAGLAHTGISAAAKGPAVLVTYASRAICIVRVSALSGDLELVATAAIPMSARSIKAKFCPCSSFDGPEYIAMGGEDTEVHISAFSSGSLGDANSIKGHLAPVTDVSWRHDGNILASCDCDGVVILWRRANVGTI